MSIQNLPLPRAFWVDLFRLYSETTPSSDELSISGGEELLAKFVSAAKGNGVKALISVGGVSAWMPVVFCLIIEQPFEVDGISILLFQLWQRGQQDRVRENHH